jgi:hypothetical protein
MQVSKTSFGALSGAKYFPSNDIDIDMPPRKTMKYLDESVPEGEYDGFVDRFGGGEYDVEGRYATNLGVTRFEGSYFELYMVSPVGKRPPHLRIGKT